MAQETFLVTGAHGCIGAWVVRQLVGEGVRVIATDLDGDPVRPRLLMSQSALDAAIWQTLDVTDTAAVAASVADNNVSHIIHLAGLQVPFCKANPPLGAAVNVLGTVNIFEAARHAGVQGLAYASSLAALGPPDLYPDTPVPDDAPTHPATLYGVYKVANEETARIYWQDWKVPSVGLRPCIVYGVARDQGISSDIAKAILATAAHRPFHVRFDGPVALEHASDVAAMFIAAARVDHLGASVFNMRNDVVDVAGFAARLTQLYPHAQITHASGAPLPVPSDLDDSGLRTFLGPVPHTPLDVAILQDMDLYTRLIAEGRIDLGQLDL